MDCLSWHTQLNTRRWTGRDRAAHLLRVRAVFCAARSRLPNDGGTGRTEQRGQRALHRALMACTPGAPEQARSALHARACGQCGHALMIGKRFGAQVRRGIP